MLSFSSSPSPDIHVTDSTVRCSSINHLFICQFTPIMTILPTSARDIRSSVSRSPPLSVSASPSTTFHSLRSGSGSPFAVRNSYFPQQSISEKQLKPFATEDIKILLLENINESARVILENQGYQVEFHKNALPEEELIEKIKFV